jgi:UDP-N-acetylglucosamine 1-carboxyvinyltransferase
MMAATLAEGVTVIEGAACEPEVVDLANFLNKMGAKIEGAGTHRIVIRGVDRLHGAEHTIVPDRIEAGSFLIAAAITGGHLSLDHSEPSHLTALIAKLEETGVRVNQLAKAGAQASEGVALEVVGSGPLRAADVVTQEYPGFPTDMQAQYMALATQADGSSVITETIFENRFLHAPELLRMGADITVDGHRAVVRGKTRLSGASVQASDLRASASLVLAGLAAEGETVVGRVYHIDRGYERVEEKLTRVGARIRRISD